MIREWLITTPAGRRALAAADVGEGELSIDRLIARREQGSMNGLNCIYNLYLMPVRHNSYFGSELTAEKRTYVGERAFKLAKAAHDTFVRDTEGAYDWDRFLQEGGEHSQSLRLSTARSSHATSASFIASARCAARESAVPVPASRCTARACVL